MNSPCGSPSSCRRSAYAAWVERSPKSAAIASSSACLVVPTAVLTGTSATPTRGADTNEGSRRHISVRARLLSLDAVPQFPLVIAGPNRRHGPPLEARSDGRRDDCIEPLGEPD